MLLLLTLLGMAWADPNPPPPTSEESGATTAPPERPSYDELLHTATRNYQLRRRDLAIQQLAALALDEDAPLHVRQEARIYLAEDRFFQDDLDGADSFFEQVIRAEPDYQIDRFRHPPDVCAQFDLVRATVLPTLPPPPPLLKPPLAWGPQSFPNIYHRRYDVRPWLDGLLAVPEWSFFAIGTSMTAWYGLNRSGYYDDTPEDRAQATRFQIAHVSMFVGWVGVATTRRLIVRQDWDRNWQKYSGVALSPTGQPQAFLGLERRF